MFWTIKLPFLITLGVWAGLIFTFTILAPFFKRDPGKSFLLTLGFACLLFIPSCRVTEILVDSLRFGRFHYATYPEVKDFRIERYLPETARDITLDKFASGYRARYSISEAELRSYLDQKWNDHGKYSAISREDLQDDSPVNYDEFRHRFDGLEWPPLPAVIQFHSPTQSDGGGAKYYFSPETGIVYQVAAYW